MFNKIYVADAKNGILIYNFFPFVFFINNVHDYAIQIHVINNAGQK